MKKEKKKKARQEDEEAIDGASLGGAVSPCSHKRKKKDEARKSFLSLLSLSFFSLPSHFASFAMSSSTPPRVNPIDRPLPKGKAEVLRAEKKV